jgi:hypothetical protein
MNTNKRPHVRGDHRHRRGHEPDPRAIEESVDPGLPYREPRGVWEPAFNEIKADLNRALYEVGPQTTSKAPRVVDTADLKIVGYTNRAPLAAGPAGKPRLSTVKPSRDGELPLAEEAYGCGVVYRLMDEERYLEEKGRLQEYLDDVAATSQEGAAMMMRWLCQPETRPAFYPSIKYLLEGDIAHHEHVSQVCRACGGLFADGVTGLHECVDGPRRLDPDSPRIPGPPLWVLKRMLSDRERLYRRLESERQMRPLVRKLLALRQSLDERRPGRRLAAARKVELFQAIESQPNASDRSIARQVGVDEKLVRYYRKKGIPH